ncbi:MAG TPA: sulfurtransferase TusA family protein [Methanoregulaceae archaeon]|nr:sulfurtransferase TusA family protein [Methanoregulaceae archaeon]
MIERIIDITGQVCPFAALSAKKEMDRMKAGESIVIMTDCPPASTETIPEIAKSSGIEIESRKTGSGIWELRLTKR